MYPVASNNMVEMLMEGFSLSYIHSVALHKDQDTEQQKKVTPALCFLLRGSDVLLFSQFSPTVWLVHDVGSDLTYWALSLPPPNLRIAFPTSITPSRRSPCPCVTAATLGESHPQSTRNASVQVPVPHWAASESHVHVPDSSLFLISAKCLQFYWRRIC